MSNKAIRVIRKVKRENKGKNGIWIKYMGEIVLAIIRGTIFLTNTSILKGIRGRIKFDNPYNGIMI